MKTSELTGAALDWAVAKCEELNPALEYTTCTRSIYIVADIVCALTGDIEGDEDYTPSTDWAQGGPIIEREKIGMGHAWIHDEWLTSAFDPEAPVMKGPTPLTAAMRCYVASKLGDEIEIPNELL